MMMTLSVRIPPRIEQELADYCARNGVSKSEAVKRALDDFLSGKKGDESPYELIKDLIGPHTDESATEDVARHSKRLLRERVRARRK
jgi:Arc/MetJ-type ribon-helix-helix transcriptional regulator